MTNDNVVDIINERLQALEHEQQRLERALAVINHDSDQNSDEQHTQPTTARKPTAHKPTTPRTTGRRQQVLAHLHGHPDDGQTVAQITRAIGAKGNYVYKLLPSLETEGHVTKHDGKYYPTDATHTLTDTTTE